MDIRFVTAGGGDVVAVMASEGGELFDAGKHLDEKSGGRIGKAMKAARFTGAAGQVVDVLAPDGIDFARVLVIGLGKLDAADGMAVERWAGHAVKRTLTSGSEKLVLQPDALPGCRRRTPARRRRWGRGWRRTGSTPIAPS
jgi:leucyl aminopeptidase